MGASDMSRASDADDQLRRASPSDLWEAYVGRKGEKRRQETMRLNRSSWDTFTEWFQESDSTHLRDLGPYFAADFQEWLRANTGKNDLSIYYELTRVRTIIEFGKGKGFVDGQVPLKWDRPEVSRVDRQRDDPLRPERGWEIGEWVRETAPYTKEEVIWTLAFEYGLRKSAIRALDLEQVVFDPDGDTPPHLKLRDRPDLGDDGDKGLPLKNTVDELSSRLVPLYPDTVELLRGYIGRERAEPGKTDEYGLNGLITTNRSARISESGIYRTISKLTAPATYEGECECDTCREFRETEGRPLPAQDRYKCQRSRSPHQVRHGSITMMINEGVDFETISHVVGTRPSTLRDVYDRRTEEERMNQIADTWIDT